MQLADFDYSLPEELIAQHPPAVRGASRLLHVAGMALTDRSFAELGSLLRAGDVLVMNDTRVIKARLYGEKLSGGRIEALVERVLDGQRALAHVRASKAPKVGGRLRFAGQWEAEVTARHDDLFELRFHTELDVFEVLERSGRLPLPPYIARAGEDPRDAADQDRYQTVYANERGAVAAPTAGLHFTTAMLESLRAAGVQLVYLTLHVGAGTFQPVRVENIAEHKMHSERFEISPAAVATITAARAGGGRVIAVGTTSMRALESAARTGTLLAQRGETDIFITPGFRFQIVDRLLTNFHLPKSTLLMLVSAFAGVDEIRHAYAHAVRERYRFFSYGDAMLLEKKSA